MKKIAKLTSIFILFASTSLFAFDAPLAKKPILDFEGEEQTNLELYNSNYLESHGVYREIESNEEDATYGEELILTGFNIEDAYKVVLAAFFPQEYHKLLPLPIDNKLITVDEFEEGTPFIELKTKAEYFPLGVLKSLKFTLEQEGGPQVIDLSIVDSGVRIQYILEVP